MSKTKNGIESLNWCGYFGNTELNGLIDRGRYLILTSARRWKLASVSYRRFYQDESYHHYHRYHQREPQQHCSTNHTSSSSSSSSSSRQSHVIRARFHHTYRHTTVSQLVQICIINARHHASAGIMLWLCVCLSVCHKPVCYQNSKTYHQANTVV